MEAKRQSVSVETYTRRSSQAAEAAEGMARANKDNTAARVAYSRLLVEQSKSFGAYVSQRINARLKKAG